MKELVDRIRKMHKETMEKKYRKCYEQHNGKDNVCKGICGGTEATDFLDEGCIDCPYLKVILR